MAHEVELLLRYLKYLFMRRELMKYHYFLLRQLIEPIEVKQLLKQTPIPPILSMLLFLSERMQK